MATVGDEDGYQIINGFLLADDIVPVAERSSEISKRSGGFARKITQNKRNPYCGGLISSYSDEMPVWTFVELISFGDLRDLVDYYSQKTGWTPPVDLQSLDRVRQIRNACAHGNAIINDLRRITDPSKTGISSTPPFITAFLRNASINARMRDRKMSNPRINQIVHLLYIYDKMVTSKNTRTKRLTELDNLLNVHMNQNSSFFQSNPLLTSTHSFFVKLVASISK